MTEIAVTALVVAKAPVPGLAKTRLAADLGDERAADIAAAALLDTLDTVAATPAAAHVVALTGDLDAAARGAEIRERLSAFTVIEQRGETFAERLVHAHADAAVASGCDAVLQIGMDTPQITPDVLASCAVELVGAHAVLGPADDGGWWLLGVAHAAIAQCLIGVPMSCPDTGALTWNALQRSGSPVRQVRAYADVDTVADIAGIRVQCDPSSRFVAATKSL